MRNLVIGLGLLLSVILTACSARNAQLSAARFDHIALAVSDPADAVAWWTRVMGAREIVNGTNQPHIRWVTLGDGQAIHLIGSKDPLPQVPKIVHLALRVSDLDGFIRHLEAEQIPYEDWLGKSKAVAVRPDNVRQVYVQAPGGYYIEINTGTGKDELLKTK